VDKQGDLFSDFFLILKVMQTTSALWRTENNKQGYSLFLKEGSLTRILISTFKSKYHGSNRYNRNRRKPLQVKNKID
jgi:hypothetical protein